MKMTSRIYGIAVKEEINYYYYGNGEDKNINPDIKLVYNKDTKHWSVISNYDNIWFNGTQYQKGSLIVMFPDGKPDTYKIMAQYTDTTPYTNYMYTVSSNIAINPDVYQNGRIEYIFEADPDNEPYKFTCKKLVNNVKEREYTLTDVDIKNYKSHNNGKLPTLFDHMKMDWHGMNPESPYLPYSFTIISNSDYIKDGTTPVPPGEIIIQIPAGVGQASYYHRILDETNKSEAKLKPGELPTIKLEKQIGKYNIVPSVTLNREQIVRKKYHDHTKVFYNNKYHRAMYLVYDTTGAQGCWKKTIKGLAFTYAEPFWLCMTTTSGFEYGGQVLEARRLVRCWKGTDSISMVLTKTKSRKKAAPETSPYDDIIYDVVSGATNVTVTRIRRKTHIDSQGHKTTEDIQEGLPIVFDTSNSPVLCWNIEFRANNNVWTIYSKCGYIKYGGRQYPKNRSILDFNAGEEMHIEIKDETEKYEVDEILTYTISNADVTKFVYKLWTVGESYVIKVQKQAYGEEPEEPITVNFYDAWLDHPVVIDDIQLGYDIQTNIWSLVSASDNLYSFDKKIDVGEVIDEWGFNTIKHIKDDRAINIVMPDAEKGVKVRVQSNKTDLKGIDVSDFLPRDSVDYSSSYIDCLITHSVTKGLWTVTSKNDNTYINGVRYTYGKEIFSCQDKQGHPEVVFMCQHKKDESGQPISPWENWHYHVTITYDKYEQIGTMLVQCKKMATAPQTGEVIVFSQTYYTREKEDQDEYRKNNYVLTMEKYKSSYGYIWKRDMPGPGPEWSLYDMICPSLGRNYSGYYAKLIGVKPGTRISLIHGETRLGSSYRYYILGRLGSNFYYAGAERLACATNYGESYHSVIGFESGTTVVAVGDLTTAIAQKIIDSNQAVFQKYSVFGSEATKFADNLCSHPYDYQVQRWIYDDGTLLCYTLSNAGSVLYRLNSGITYSPVSDIAQDCEDLKREYNYTIVDQETGWIETRRVSEFSYYGGSRQYLIGDSIYIIVGPITCVHSGGYAHIPNSGFSYLEFNWEYCAYRLNKNGLSSLITNFMTNEEVSVLLGTSQVLCAKYNNNYYGSGIDYNEHKLNIYCFDTKIRLVKTISQSSKIRIKVYQSRDCSEYEYYDLYFDGRSYSYANREIGFSGIYNNHKIDSKRFYIQFDLTIGSGTSTRGLCILIDNPLLEESIGNFAFFESIT